MTPGAEADSEGKVKIEEEEGVEIQAVTGLQTAVAMELVSGVEVEKCVVKLRPVDNLVLG